MNNANGGYIGFSRSVRSEESLYNFEVPLSLLNKDLIGRFILEYDHDFRCKQLMILQQTPIVIWKYVAKHKINPASWHHTSSYFNKTDHYSLAEIAQVIIDETDTLGSEYAAYCHARKQQKSFKYSVIRVAVWGGSRNYPRITGYTQESGIVVDDWLYYTGETNQDATHRYKTTANRVDWLKTFDTYTQLTKSFPEYKNTKKMFTFLISKLK